MKKLLLILTVVAFATSANAQELGLRFNGGGKNFGSGIAIDGIFELGQFSRIHADVVFFDGGIGAEALYNFVHQPLPVELAGLNWYAGAGLAFNAGNSFFNAGVNVEAGLEYDFRTEFNLPFTISMDYRPTLWIIESTQFNFGGFGVNLRYCF